MRLRLLLLALGTFAVGTDSMVMAGILGLISRDLDVSVPTAGQMVTVFALAYALLAPVLATVTARWPRRRLLLTALAFFTAANALSALAPTYPLLLATRVLAAAGAALYTPTANAVATSLVPPERRGRALATVLGGMTVATALGVPLGTWIGRADWRLTMWLVVALGAAALAGQALLLRDLPGLPGRPAAGGSAGAAAGAGAEAGTPSAPTTPPTPLAPPGLRERLAPLRDRRVVGATATTFLFFLAFNSVYIYVATAVRPATGGEAGRLSLVMLVMGVASVAGSWLGGRAVDHWGVRSVLLTGSAVTALAFLALPWLGRTMPGALLYALVTPVAGWSASVALPHRLASLDPPNAPLLISLNSSALYLGMAAGGGAGSVSVALLGDRWFPLTAMLLALLATATVLATTRTPRAPEPPAPSPPAHGKAAAEAGRSL
ncbi:MFS transporter [Streptomyces sp. ME19-01-6]|uniref:MFS transporter n=1 Tax=Streptomyces sp. ME19-01-6 TaxID=3028686 RepID=UPI0029B2AB44|nr:MFS transporter [Streptomyces sp. ME19-01-6]MDX3227300.1 MFS transporter [Streptomyces sp. ME19-01-6]